MVKIILILIIAIIFYTTVYPQNKGSHISSYLSCVYFGDKEVMVNNFTVESILEEIPINSMRYLASTIKCEYFLIVSNGFILNGDRYDDELNLVCKNLDYFKVHLNNRWRKVLFESKEPNIEWNRKHEGKNTLSRVCYYQFIYSSRIQNIENRLYSLKISIT